MASRPPAPATSPGGAPPTLIFNPFARSSRAGRLRERLRGLAEGFLLVPTRCPGDATARAAEAARAGSPIVVAAGGDGTINEVINGIVGTRAILGVLPTGTVNLLARELSIPLGLEGAWEVVRRGHTVTVDLVRVDAHGGDAPRTLRLVQVGGVGLDAHVVSRVTPRAKTRWGPFSYAFEALKSLRDPLPEISMVLDGAETVSGSFALFGNGRFYGGPVPVFPSASMRDGKIDLCLFESRAPLQVLRYLQAVLRGVHPSTQGILYRQAQEVEVRAPAPVPLQLDGEYAGCLPGRLVVEPSSLAILAPP